MIRWKRLENFPKDVLDGISKHYFDYHKQDVATIENQVPNIQPHLRIVTIDYPVNLPGFHNYVSFFISDPKMGMATVHTDKSRSYSLNFPIQVDHSNSNYVAGIHTELNQYKGRQTFTINGKTGTTYEYHPEDFEDVALTHATLINTDLPHSWTNYSSDYRVVGSLFMGYSDINEVMKHVEQWT
jgi:hypothetical protein